MKSLITVFFLIFLICTPLNVSSLTVRVSISSQDDQDQQYPMRIQLPQLKAPDVAKVADAFDLDSMEAPSSSTVSAPSIKLKIRSWISGLVNRIKSTPHAAFVKNIFSVTYKCATQKMDAAHCSSILSGLKDAVAKYKTNIPKLIQTVEAALASPAPEADFDSYDGPGPIEYISIGLIIAGCVVGFFVPAAMLLFPLGFLLEGVKMGFESLGDSSRERAYRKEDEMRQQIEQQRTIIINNQENSPNDRYLNSNGYPSSSYINNPHVSDNQVDNSQQNQIRNQNGINGNRNSIDNSYRSQTSTTTTTNTNSNNSATKICLFGCSQEAEIDEADTQE